MQATSHFIPPLPEDNLQTNCQIYMTTPNLTGTEVSVADRVDAEDWYIIGSTDEERPTASSRISPDIGRHYNAVYVGDEARAVVGDVINYHPPAHATSLWDSILQSVQNLSSAVIGGLLYSLVELKYMPKKFLAPSQRSASLTESAGHLLGILEATPSTCIISHSGSTIVSLLKRTRLGVLSVARVIPLSSIWWQRIIGFSISVYAILHLLPLLYMVLRLLTIAIKAYMAICHCYLSGLMDECETNAETGREFPLFAILLQTILT